MFFTYQNGMVKTSVRQLVEFLLREGDIHSQGALVADVELMQAGSRIHRKIQKNQKITYHAEVPLKMEWQQEKYRLLLEGRADGIDHDEEGYYIDEIKGMMQNVLEYEDAKPLHLAQAKCYAAMYMMQKHLDRIGVQITYCNMETEEIKQFRTYYTSEELEEWFSDLIDSYKLWADAYISCRQIRQESIENLKFPFEYREGQKKLLAMVYHGIRQKKKSFFQAPTGVGKTISTIYPSLKCFLKDGAEKICYLTAKTITRTVAEDTLRILRQQGMRLKAVTITAKEKMCVNDVFECNPGVCSRAEGHYDRINKAVYELFMEEDTFSRETILEYAEKYEVCPYELSFEMAAFCDFIICDYNYIFDPHVNRSRIQDDTAAGKTILLVDEAHNLVERAREMYSAEWAEEDIKRLKKLLPTTEKKLHRKLNACRKEMKKIKDHFLEVKFSEENEDAFVELEDVDVLYFPLVRFGEALLEYLMDHPVFPDREEVVERFFSLRHFTGIMESMTEGYRIYGIWAKHGFWVRLFCIDPSSQLKEIMDQKMSAILFSATLLPMPYYRNLLYGESAEAFAISSPFDSKKRLLCITNDVTSRYSRRGKEEYRKILSYVEESVRIKKGNYMVFFPSYEMMEATFDLVHEGKLLDHAEIVLQESMMEEREKEEFLANFQEERKKSLVGFCVLGSIFSEGIDLSGDRLIGVFIVGTGLPKVCVERNMIRGYFDSHDKKGYDYAYRYPGMNKVLQAAGRVIRSVEDVGMIVLMDERFLWKENQYLLPDDWDRYFEVSRYNFGQLLEDFWKDINP